MSGPSPRSVNRWAARIVPLCIVGILSYVSWVFIGTLCVEYLLRPPIQPSLSRRAETAVGLIIVYAILLLVLLLYYIRVIQIITVNPGYIPLGADWEERGRSPERENEQVLRSCAVTTVPEGRTKAPTAEKDDLSQGTSASARDPNFDLRAMLTGVAAPPPGMEQFYRREAFVCDYRGIPIFCSKCRNWKPDRTHHCSEIERCVRRMDHFCPWVGGIVSETNMKHFIQFVAAGACFTALVLITMAFFLAERKRLIGDVNGHWLAAVALGAMFFLFTFGMTASTVHLTVNGLTTVENLGRGYRTYYVAVLIDKARQQASLSQDPGSSTDYQPSSPFNTITFSTKGNFPPLLDPPLRPSEYVPNTALSNGSAPQGSVDQPSSSYTAASAEYANGLTFAILQTAPDDNLWDLGISRNWQAVMGYSILDWVSPFRYSPHCSHSPENTEFEYGPALARMKKDAGIESPDVSHDIHRSRRRRRRRHSNRNDIPLQPVNSQAEIQKPDETAERSGRRSKRRH